MRTSDKELKLELIEAIIKTTIEEDKLLNAWYELIVNRDKDYIEELFYSKEDFEEFIEKWTPKKCCVKEEDND